jgi:hypothetical protein
MTRSAQYRIDPGRPTKEEQLVRILPRDTAPLKRGFFMPNCLYVLLLNSSHTYHFPVQESLPSVTVQVLP